MIESMIIGAVFFTLGGWIGNAIYESTSSYGYVRPPNSEKRRQEARKESRELCNALLLIFVVPSSIALVGSLFGALAAIVWLVGLIAARAVQLRRRRINSQPPRTPGYSTRLAIKRP